MARNVPRGRALQLSPLLPVESLKNIQDDVLDVGIDEESKYGLIYQYFTCIFICYTMFQQAIVTRVSVSHCELNFYRIYLHLSNYRVVAWWALVHVRSGCLSSFMFVEVVASDVLVSEV